MNEKIKSYILPVIISLLLGSAVTFFFCQRSSSIRIEQYRSAESAALTLSGQLRSELSESNDRLSVLNAELQQYRNYNAKAREILASQRSSIDKLRALIQSLPD